MCAAIFARSSGSGGGGHGASACAHADSWKVSGHTAFHASNCARRRRVPRHAHRVRRLRQADRAQRALRRLGQRAKVVVGRARPQQHLELAVAPPHALQVADLVLAQRVELAHERADLLRRHARRRRLHEL